MPSNAQKRRGSVKSAACAWCGERKPLNLIRHPLSSRGPTPSTCHACRESHPDEAWCDFHGMAHPRSDFPAVSRPIGVLNICDAAVAYTQATKRAKPDRTCVACGREQESWQFRGGRHKSATCRDCEAGHPDGRWCLGCRAWLSAEKFHRTGRDSASLTPRCKVCDLANRHGLTREEYDELVGADPMCAACGGTENLKIDHDHAHCPTRLGCRECVRGVLCHGCNTAEGLLRSAERARALAEYMERWSVR